MTNKTTDALYIFQVSLEAPRANGRGFNQASFLYQVAESEAKALGSMKVTFPNYRVTVRRAQVKDLTGNLNDTQSLAAITEAANG